MAFLSALLQPFVDNQTLLAAISGSAFDLDLAVGVQLDVIGQWVGADRNLAVPLTGVYFSWNTSGLGWDQGTWLGPYDSTTGLVQLPDDSFRQLLRATIAKNYWDGTVPGAYSVWGIVFDVSSGAVLIQDNQDMTITVVFFSSSLDAVQQALIANQYFDLCPAGVRVTGYYTPSITTAPVFGWGIEASNISGWGTGAWLKQIAAGNTTDGINPRNYQKPEEGN